MKKKSQKKERKESKEQKDNTSRNINVLVREADGNGPRRICII